ncbi:putative disease resistance protein RGA3 [Typha latifolia]|uniref:putative disease resistance protein RGA3 n=1 Tax=Typha latifolia TaxID=4733 RepID=UPI003C2FC0C7
MASELMISGWFVSNIAGNLITALIAYAEEQWVMQLGLEDELRRLKKALPKIQAVVNAVNNGHMREGNPDLERWLQQFKDAADEAENLMDELEYHQMEEDIKGENGRMSRAASRFKTILMRAVHKDPTLKRLKKVMKELDEVAADVGDFFRLVDTLKQQQQHLIPSSRQTTNLLTGKVFGRENETEEVIKRLLNFNIQFVERRFCILPIVGGGGVGKTTLAQYVYDDERVKKHFKLRMWVCVSNTFDVLSLTKKIYESASKKTPGFVNPDVLVDELQKHLKSKRVLLVLDDVWNDNDRISWQNLLAPFQSVERGSIIMVTTRMKTVGNMMRDTLKPFFLEGLNEDDYWKFFKECAFPGEDIECHRKLQDIGRKIAKKLKGSPLAAKTVGGALSANLDIQHWENILHSEIWEIKQGENDIISALRLSYLHLSSHLKPCFTFCSIFPQDYEFDKDELVHMWMALGLVQEDKNRRPEDVGYTYFDDLLKKSFFDVKTHLFHQYYVMHDLLHDLAKFVSQGECFRVLGDNIGGLQNTVRHLSVQDNNFPELDISNLKNLHTIFLHCVERHPRLHCVIFEKLAGLKSLRILKLSAKYCHNLPDCIGDLIHLRYLHCDNIEYTKIPKSVGKLYNLQVMSFSNEEYDYSDTRPQQIPLNGLNNLIRLRYLTMSQEQHIVIIGGIGGLSSLQKLNFFCTRGGEQSIYQLKDLGELRELHIQNLQNVRNHEEANQANLEKKVHLHTLVLEWGSKHRETSAGSEFDNKVIDHLKPYLKLKVLKIRGYAGLMIPCWMTTKFLPELGSVELSNCRGLTDLSPLEELPSLTNLCLENMDAVKRFGQSHYSAKTIIFPSLQVLEFCSMSKLKEWNGGGRMIQWLPCLRKLVVSRCPKLRILPPLPCSLRELIISDAALDALPVLWLCSNNKCESSSISSSLASLKLDGCSRILSLAEGLLLHTRHYTALKDIKILNCRKLMHLPTEGFRRFISLKKLVINECPKLQICATSDVFLPPSLQLLKMVSCGDLDKILIKSLEEITNLSELEIKLCANITGLPSFEVFGRWKELQKLSIEDCGKLESIDGLQALSSLKCLTIRGCPKLVAVASSPLALTTFQHFSVLASEVLAFLQRLPGFLALMYSPNRFFSKLAAAAKKAFMGGSSSVLDELHIDNFSLLCTEPLRSLSVRVATIEYFSEFKSSITQWMLQNHTCLQELRISRVDSQQFPPVDLQSLSSLQLLILNNASQLQSMPLLPLSLKTLHILDCDPMLEEMCQEGSGPDWPKIEHIPDIIIGSYHN